MKPPPHIPSHFDHIPAPEPTATHGRGPRAPRHVLLVEDDRFIAELLRRHVSRLGHQVTLHMSSREALTDFCARPRAFDLLITDNTMPGMSGLELVREVHKVREDLPVLMISGLGEHAAVDLRALGIRRILPKPHPHEELVAAIRELLG